jgi:hypothetical protein
MSTIFPNVPHSIDPLIVAALLITFTSCSGGSMTEMGSCQFVSLQEEQAFWTQQRRRGADSPWLLEPFYGEANRESLGPVNDRLFAAAKASDIFALVIQTNVDNGVFQIVSLARNENRRWQQIRWEETEQGCLKESVSEREAIAEDIFRNLSRTAVFLDASDEEVDADSIYVFLKYAGGCSRFAIYNPFRVAGSTKAHPAASCVRALLKSIGVAPREWKARGEWGQPDVRR